MGRKGIDHDDTTFPYQQETKEDSSWELGLDLVEVQAEIDRMRQAREQWQHLLLQVSPPPPAPTLQDPPEPEPMYGPQWRTAGEGPADVTIVQVRGDPNEYVILEIEGEEDE